MTKPPTFDEPPIRVSLLNELLNEPEVVVEAVVKETARSRADRLWGMNRRKDDDTRRDHRVF
jgi:hypothetical protein